MIKVEHLNKEFVSKKKHATTSFKLDDVSFEVEDGDTLGIIGKNGSGKSTLLKLLTLLIKPDSGSIYYNDKKISTNDYDFKKKIGVLFGGDVSLYTNFTAYENIEYFAKLNGLEDDEIKKRIEKYSNYFGMNNYIDKKVVNFSRGMKQKTSFVRSIIHEPEIIFLDEPSTGLDIQAIKEVWGFIKYNQNRKKTIFISSHNMEEITSLCNKILILNNGKVTYFGPTKDVIGDDGMRINEYLGVSYVNLQNGMQEGN